MEIIIKFIETWGTEILSLIITGMIAYIGFKGKEVELNQDKQELELKKEETALETQQYINQRLLRQDELVQRLRADNDRLEAENLTLIKQLACIPVLEVQITTLKEQLKNCK